MNIVTRSWTQRLMLLLALAALQSQADEDKTTAFKAPNFQAVTLTGETVQLSDFIGKKPVYLKFWATWCRYCVAEMPRLQAIYDEFGSEIAVLSINVGLNDSVENIEKLFGENGYQLPVVFDRQGEITTQFGVVGTPHHILIDRKGLIAYRTFLSSDTLDQMIQVMSREKTVNAEAGEESVFEPQLVLQSDIKHGEVK